MRIVNSEFRIGNSRMLQHSGGFTLIELILASGLFAMVLVMGFSVLSDAGRLNDRTQAQRRVGQTAQTALETIGREIRLANGLLDITSEGKLTQLASPFIFRNGSTDGQGRTVASSIQINQTDFPSVFAPQPKAQLVTLVTTGNDRYLELRVCQTTDCTSYSQQARITPVGVVVEDFQISGVSHTLQDSTRLPVVTLRLTIADLLISGGAATSAVRQTLETTVTTRNLREKLP